MHTQTPESRALRNQIIAYAQTRMDYDPAPLDGPKPFSELLASAGQTITRAGLGGKATLAIWESVLSEATISSDHPGHVAYIPNAPTEAASAFDLVVAASSIFGGSWQEGAGAIYAENQVLAWLAKEVGLPETAGGVFVQGGTLGNLSALVTARDQARANGLKAERYKFVCSREAHSSLKHAARVMDVDVVLADVNERGQLTGVAVEAALEGQTGVFAIVATGGTTNFGIVDKLREVGEVSRKHNLWFHIDGAYGIAGILAESAKELFDGSELADSFIVDPHKWLFAPFDCCALVYRNPKVAKAAHTQHAEYLDELTDSSDFNPSDYAVNLTRRARGLPLWFSLAVHGTDAYHQTIEETMQTTRAITDEIRKRSYLKLVREPMLSVVAFQRIGWTKQQYQVWCDKLLQDQLAFVVPSSHNGEPMLRFAIVNPKTSLKLLIKVLDTLEK
ncbi:MAG: pyridoxal phosphate-dependent decarboxylase family protein [Micrococcales bacterium]